MAKQQKNKTVKGVAWSGIDNVAQFGVSFVVSIVLARLLSPNDYWVIGIFAIYTAVCNTLINAGFTTTLIRKKCLRRRFQHWAFEVTSSIGSL